MSISVKSESHSSPGNFTLVIPSDTAVGDLIFASVSEGPNGRRAEPTVAYSGFALVSRSVNYWSTHNVYSKVATSEDIGASISASLSLGIDSYDISNFILVVLTGCGVVGWTTRVVTDATAQVFVSGSGPSESSRWEILFASEFLTPLDHPVPYQPVFADPAGFTRVSTALATTHNGAGDIDICNTMACWFNPTQYTVGMDLPGVTVVSDWTSDAQNGHSFIGILIALSESDLKVSVDHVEGVAPLTVTLSLVSWPPGVWDGFDVYWDVHSLNYTATSNSYNWNPQRGIPWPAPTFTYDIPAAYNIRVTTWITF